ncbi:MAG: putative nicotinate-nucleotide adenylyltransferase [Bacteroidia bacterium]|nr:MAG: putative nicotinate-nucleotide adenylyltransferase [Bacteroidia bacterium]
MPASKKIGLFFGSFNPIHIGHLAIANYFAEFTDLNEIWFVVSPHNPLKEKKSLLAQHHRFYMVNLAIEDYPKFRSSDIEFHLPQPSYTIHTLAHLKEKYPHYHFALLLGQDNLSTFHKWKNFEVILEKYKLYIYPRPNSTPSDFDNHPNVVFTDAPQIEISSTFIRNAIKEKKDIRFFFTSKSLGIH